MVFIVSSFSEVFDDLDVISFSGVMNLIELSSFSGVAVIRISFSGVCDGSFSGVMVVVCSFSRGVGVGSFSGV